MTEVERRRRPRIHWIDRSIRSKALVVVVLPTAVLAGALVATATQGSTGWRLLDVGALVLALALGLLLWHFFTTGVISRLQRLERDAATLPRAGRPGETPAARDEIGRLAARLDEATRQVREYSEERDRAERELTDVLTASPVVSLRYDVAARRFSYASPNVERLLGVRAQEVLEHPDLVMSRFHPDDALALRDAFVRGRGRGDDRLSMVLRCRRSPDEDWREVEALYALETDERDMPTMVGSYLVDVSERHAAQRQAESRRFLLESIFHASPDTIVVRDARGEVVLASSSLAEVIEAEGAESLEPDQLIEEAFRYGKLRREERVRLQRLIERCRSGERDLEPVITTGRARRAGRGHRTYETRARPVFDEHGNVTGTVTVSRDITERMQLEQSLRQTTVEAQRASEAKSQFLSRMSHELRTPLNAILGFAQLMELDELTDDQASSVDQIQRAGRHLLSLINEVLDISRIEAGRLTVSTQPVPVGDVLDEVAALLSPMAEAAAIHLMVDRDCPRHEHVRADRRRLLQVLLNLGSNAVKYNEPGGTVAFRAEVVGGERLRFSVHDTGPGIAPDKQELLFVPFSRLDAETSAVEGTGVGLALSKQLVEVMGGEIGVDSTPGHGSTFWVELHLAGPGDTAGIATAPPSESAPVGAHHLPPAAAPATTTGDADECATPVLTVLHVEDNPSNASLVAQVLARRPEVRLITAAEARLGVELARRHRPDLLLLDLHLPDMPGDTVLEQIKAMAETTDTKVVVLSADATPDRIRRLLDLGVAGYLTKPVDVEALLRLVDDEVAGGATHRP